MEVPLQEPQVPPDSQGPQVPPMPQAPFFEGYMTNAELQAALTNLTQLMTAEDHVVNNHLVGQANQGYRPQPNSSTTTCRIRNLMRMNPPTFHGSKVYEDSQGFIDEVFKVVDARVVTPRDKVGFSNGGVRHP